MRLSPVRSPVSLRRNASARPSAEFIASFPGRTLQLYDSGTAALATAIRDALLRHGSASPEVIFPAYGCPQLVSACLYAGARPRFVDTAAGQWGYDAQALRNALTPDTVAVVAADLLGVGDQAAQLLPLVRANGSYLVQDSAQHLPSEPHSWCGDYVVLSFGRGKPLNLLRGGALAVPEQNALREDAPLREGGGLAAAAMESRAAGLAFNIITHPWVYGVASRLPGLGLGATVYSPVQSVTRLSPAVWGQAGPAYVDYSRRPDRFLWDAVLPGWRQLDVHELTCAGSAQPARQRRLRLAVLAADRATRDRLVAGLDEAGLGASVMYGTAVDGIQNIPEQVRAQRPFPNATQLADRLLTLPTHSAVTAATVARTDALLRAILTP